MTKALFDQVTSTDLVYIYTIILKFGFITFVRKSTDVSNFPPQLFEPHYVTYHGTFHIVRATKYPGNAYSISRTTKEAEKLTMF